MQCAWCRLCYHNKPECFESALLSVSCQLGKHAKLIIPPTWIVKMANQASYFSPSSFGIYLECLLVESIQVYHHICWQNLPPPQHSVIMALK